VEHLVHERPVLVLRAAVAGRAVGGAAARAGVPWSGFRPPIKHPRRIDAKRPATDAKPEHDRTKCGPAAARGRPKPRRLAPLSTARSRCACLRQSSNLATSSRRPRPRADRTVQSNTRGPTRLGQSFGNIVARQIFFPVPARFRLSRFTLGVHSPDCRCRSASPAASA